MLYSTILKDDCQECTAYDEYGHEVWSDSCCGLTMGSVSNRCQKYIDGRDGWHCDCDTYCQDD